MQSKLLIYENLEKDHYSAYMVKISDPNTNNINKHGMELTVTTCTQNSRIISGVTPFYILTEERLFIQNW